MLLRLMLPSLLLLMTARSLCADDARAASLATVAATGDSSERGVQFSLDIAAAGGATLTTINGRDPQQTGELIGRYAMAARVPPRQPAQLVLRMTEDATIKGPDGQPGVLRLEYVELSYDSLSSDFEVLGDEASGLITVPAWTRGETTPADLQRTFIEFKFRSDNVTDGGRIGGLYAFRMDPERDDSAGYGRRADFGTLIATPRWRTFRRPIGSANNLEWFLTSLNEDNPTSFRLIWSQNGPIQSYAPGDSLLIDDLKIVVE